MILDKIINDATPTVETICYGGGISSSDNGYYPAVVFGVVVTDTGVDVMKRAKARYIFAGGGSGSFPPDKVWKDVYVVKDGVLVKTGTIEGKHVPNHTHTVPESITFP